MIYLFERVILARALEESILLQNTNFIQHTLLFFRVCFFEKFHFLVQILFTNTSANFAVLGQ